MHRHAAARLKLTSATELSDLNTVCHAWMHGKVGSLPPSSLTARRPHIEVFNNYGHDDFVALYKI